MRVFKRLSANQRKGIVFLAVTIGLLGWGGILCGTLTFEQLSAGARWLPFRCPLHLLTGWYCPMCGLGRALLALSLGQLRESWEWNPLGPLFAGVGGSAGLLYIFAPKRFMRSAILISKRWRALGKKWKVLALVGYLAVAIARNIGGSQ